VTEPLIIPRAEHPISRNDIDADALRVLSRLNENEYTAYLVGGSVRDLLLGRRPKDFDIGTDAHPYEIKKLFRNCWIIGRRFRLAHIKYGAKTIEVATFRQNVPDASAVAAAEPVAAGDATDAAAAPRADGSTTAPEAQTESRGERRSGDAPRPRAHSDEHGIVRRDNLYGTPEEDAFRRDFTVNALFYDIATRSVIDYTGGLEDLRQRRIVCIGDPTVRFTEDPVRMLRAAVFAARLDFEMDEAVLDAIETHGHLIQKASPARLLEEYFKILRSGHAEATFRVLDGVGLLGLITPELQDAPDVFWTSLKQLDAWRSHHPSIPQEMVNPVLLGALLVPLGFVNPHEDQLMLGMLTLPRKDYERLRHLLVTVPKLTDQNLPVRVARGLPGRPSFSDAITWLDVFGDAPDAVAHWKHVQSQMPKPEPRPHRGHTHGPAARPLTPGHPHTHAAHHTSGAPAAGDASKRRRRRRRRRGGGGGHRPEGNS
jgi:poly(A) polymerase